MAENVWKLMLLAFAWIVVNAILCDMGLDVQGLPGDHYFLSQERREVVLVSGRNSCGFLSCPVPPSPIWNEELT